jgi:hypothetical protein
MSSGVKSSKRDAVSNSARIRWQACYDGRLSFEDMVVENSRVEYLVFRQGQEKFSDYLYKNLVDESNAKLRVPVSEIQRVMDKYEEGGVPPLNERASPPNLFDLYSLKQIYPTPDEREDIRSMGYEDLLREVKETDVETLVRMEMRQTPKCSRPEIKKDNNYLEKFRKIIGRQKKEEEFHIVCQEPNCGMDIESSPYHSVYFHPEKLDRKDLIDFLVKRSQMQTQENPNP